VTTFLNNMSMARFLCAAELFRYIAISANPSDPCVQCPAYLSNPVISDGAGMVGLMSWHWH